MTSTRTLTTTEIDDGWFLDEATPREDDEAYAEYVLEEAPPSSGFEQAFLEQVEGRRLKRRFGDASATFGVLRLN
ncbi:MAG TPA: hypothetical protein VJ694_04730 [Patescibacteria group bacterium]|nr:hypothetical protein [Patescibacteria group bacterium]